MLPRHTQDYVATLLRHFPCVAVNGVRQCGKTTLLGALPGGWQRFDMESAADCPRRGETGANLTM